MDLFGIPNMKKDWLKRHGTREIPDDIIALAKQEREKHEVKKMARPSKPKGKKSAKTIIRRISKKVSDVNSDEFLSSYEWRQVRMKVLKRDGAKCACCGATPASGSVMNVDHIKPRRKYPELALDESNLQVLCHDCNHGKGNWDETDWR